MNQEKSTSEWTEESTSKDSQLAGFISVREANVRRDPSDIGARAGLALAYAWNGRSGDARREFYRCLRASPDDGEVLFYYGQFLCSQGRLQESIDALKRAVANADHPAIRHPAMGGLGAVLHMAGRLPEAIKVWASMLDLGAELDWHGAFTAVLSLGITHLQQDHLEEAWHTLTVAASLQERHEVSGIAQRFPSWALDLGKNRLWQMRQNPRMQEVFNLLVAIAWGVLGPVAHSEMQERVLMLLATPSEKPLPSTAGSRYFGEESNDGRYET